MNQESSELQRHLAYTALAVVTVYAKTLHEPRPFPLSAMHPRLSARRRVFQQLAA